MLHSEHAAIVFEHTPAAALLPDTAAYYRCHCVMLRLCDSRHPQQYLDTVAYYRGHCVMM